MTGIPSFVKTLMAALDRGGYESFVVGGAVRSALLGVPVHDYDLTTNATPDQMKEVFRGYRTIETGIRHGTLTVVCEGKPVEITTYRKDSAYGDHRHPDHVEFTSALQEDCARRDFTVNAMCAGMDGSILDFFGGREDLRNRIIRCIGNPDARFDEDALRILRALRFAARLSFSIDGSTAEALRRNKDLLNFISAERIHDELNGFLEAPGCTELLKEYREVFEVFIPDLKALTAARYDSLCEALERAPGNSLIRLALLLSYVQQPKQILKRLKYSNTDSRLVLSLIAGKEKPAAGAADIRRAVRDYQDDVPAWISYRCALDSSLDEENILNIYRKIIADGDCCSLKQLAVNGDDLVQAGFRGKQIAEALDTLLEEVIEKRLPNSRHELIKYSEVMKKW